MITSIFWHTLSKAYRLGARWTRTTIHTPKDWPPEEGHVYCYVLPKASWSNLQHLQKICEEKKLPIPNHSLDFIVKKDSENLTSGCYAFIEGDDSDSSHKENFESSIKTIKDQQLDIHLIPVSIFWGRDPGKDYSKTGFFQSFWTDDNQRRFFSKFITFLLQGRRIHLIFGKPTNINSNENYSRFLQDENLGRNIRRLFRIHFSRERTSFLGPVLYTRNQIVSWISNSATVKRAWTDEGHSLENNIKYQKKVKSYVDKMAADVKPNYVHWAGTLLHYISNFFFDEIHCENIESCRELGYSSQVIYLPCHRSHIDYLLMDYLIWKKGLNVPHTAAGENLNFWPVGHVLRRAGAFFLKRKFGANRFYTAVFSEYLHFLISKGYPIQFFIEGGRSRTGDLLPPKTGMLAMVVQSYLRNPIKPIKIVPVYIGYDRVAEGKHYDHELRGNRKKKESAYDLLRFLRNIKKSHGDAYVRFGRPIDLEEFLNEQKIDWKKDQQAKNFRPSWMPSTTNLLGRRVLEVINRNVILSPIGLTSLILVTAPNHAVSEEEMLGMIQKLKEIIKGIPNVKKTPWVDRSSKEILEHATKHSPVQMAKSRLGRIYYVAEKDLYLSRYYRNNALPTLALPSLLACLFLHFDKHHKEDVFDFIEPMFRHIKKEIYLITPEEKTRKKIGECIDILVECGLLQVEKDHSGNAILKRPQLTGPNFAQLNLLGAVLRQVCERYAMADLVLSKYANREFQSQEFITFNKEIYQHLAILRGRSSKFYDASHIKGYIETMKEQGILDSKNKETYQLNVDPAQLKRRARPYMSSHMFHNIEGLDIQST